MSSMRMRHPATFLSVRLAVAALLIPAALIAMPADAATPSASALPRGVTQVTSVEGITEYRLPNGLRVLLAPDESKPTTTVNMTYLVGSRHENYGETGMAHLLEHMLFKGTPTMRNALGEFSRRGLRANGSTWLDRTNYFASFAANEENLDWYLRWQADAMVNSTILRSDLDTEMTVVRNEMENGENDPFRSLMSKMSAVAFQWHNYGKSTIGARSDVEKVDIDRLRAFYKTYYQPDNAVLIVSGQFDQARTLASISRTFGKLPKPTRTLPRLYTEEPVQDGERSVTLRRTGGSPLLAALYHVPAGSAPDAAAVSLLSGILGDSPSGRLYRSLVEKRLAAGTYGFSFETHDPGTMMFAAQLPSMQVQAEARDAMLQTLESIKETPVTEEELERARTKWLKDWDVEYADPQKVGVALSESIALGDWRTFFLARDRVRAVKLADVQRVAESYLVASNRTLGAYVPTEAPQRAPQQRPVDLQATLKGYTGDRDFVMAEAFDSSPANIDARTRRKTLDLPNGPVQLALLPKSTRGKMVKAKLIMQFADAERLRGKMDVSRAVAALVYRGTPTMTRQQIDDKLDSLRADVGIAGSGTDVTASISTTRENLPETIALVTDILRNANFPEAQLDEYQRGELAGIEDARQEPDQVAQRTLARHGNPWPAGDVRYVQTFDEKAAAIQSLTRQQLVDFHNEFYGAGTIRFVAVGDFDADAAEKSVVAGLKDWKTAPAYQRISDPYRPIEAKNFDLPLPDKANAFYMATMPLKLQDTSPDYPALMLANFLLGQSETSRLWMRVREKEGLSYNVRSSLNVSLYEPTSDWMIYAIYAPSNRDKVETAIREELARVAREGFTATEVKDGIASMLSTRRLNRAQDALIVRTWGEYLELGRTFAYSGELDDKIRALTTEQVNVALRKYLTPTGFSAAAAGDFRAK